MIYGSTPGPRGKAGHFLSIALALAGVACGDPNNPNGISAGGSGAGRGGGASSAGRSGAAGAETGGTSGSGGGATDGADAGSAGASPSAGAGGTQGSGGSGGRPPGCPEPNPIPVAGQTIVIQSININTSELVLRNAASTPQSIRLGREGWQWCAYPRYWSLTDQEITVELAPGETYAFIAINNQSGPVALVPEEGEMAIYALPQRFDDYEAVQAFAAWGDVQAFRETYAVQKGVWTFDERIQIAPGHAGFIATGVTNRASGYTSVPARCLVP